MSDLYDTLAEFAQRPETYDLVDAIEELLTGKENGVVIAALSQVLICAHVDTQVTEEGRICEPCSNAELTELFQALRQLNGGMIEDIPKESH